MSEYTPDVDDLRNAFDPRNLEEEKMFTRAINKIRAEAWDECNDMWEFAYSLNNLEPQEHVKDNPYREGGKP